MGGSIKGVLFLAVVVGCILTKGVGFALEPLSDEALDETHAASGIRFDIDSLYMNYSADELGFITHENLPAYWGSPTSPYWKPTESDYRYGKLYAQNVLASNIKVDGSLTLESGVFPFAAQSYAVRDTWKNESGNMAFKRQKYIHDIDPIYTLTATLPEFNARNRDVIRITMAPGSGSSVVELGSMAGQLFVDYSENNNQGASATTEALARLGIDGVRLIDQQMMLYPLADIPKYSGSNELYASGEGVAFELGMRLSIDAIGLRSPGYVAPSGSGSWSESHKGDLVLKGIHLRESFNDPWIIDAYNDSSWPTPPSKYDYFGRITRINNFAWISSSDISKMYAYGTGDSGGYQTGDESKLFSANSEILSQWRGTALDPDVVDRMYGGRFMLGNLRQIHFHDYIAGNGEIAFHENHSNQIDHPGMSDDVNGENPIDRQNGKSSEPKADTSKIVERPATVSFITRGDGSTCLAMNLPIHGSLRVEEVMGYNSSGSDNYLGGNSMGPIVVEGLRIKRFYLEFPGRNEAYTLTTRYFPSSGSSVATHPYKYRAGHLPIPQSLPANQHDDDCIGRGVAWFMERLSPITGNQATSPGGLADQYVTRLGGSQFGEGRSYWKIAEHLPYKSDYKLY